MRIILIVLTTCLLTLTVWAQPDKQPDKPTQKQMNAQLQQAQMEGRRLITDMEKQLADAKANNEDPETIQSLEKQLATLIQMMGTVNKVQATGFEKPKKNLALVDKIPEYKSPIVPIALKQAVTTPTEAQAKDRLLWYKGKKIDPVTLITTRGMVVRYSRSSNMVIVRPDPIKDSPMVKLVRNLSKTGQRRSQFVSNIAAMKNSFLMYPEIQKAFDEFEILQERYDRVAKNTIDLPAPGTVRVVNYNNPISTRSGPSGDGEGPETYVPAGLDDLYRQLKTLLEQEPNQPLDFSAPPKRPSDVCLCDPSIRRQYELDLSQWSIDYCGFEENLLQAAKNIHGHLVFNPQSSVADMPTMYSDVDRAIRLAVARKDKKNELLIQRYADQPEREETLVLAVLSTEREKQKLGVADLNSANVNYLKNMLNGNSFPLFIERRIVAKEYNQVLDYSLYLSHEFHKQLLGNPVNVQNTGFFRWKGFLDKFNKFNMTVNLDFEYHQVDDKTGDPVLKADGILESDSVRVSMGRLGCRWQLFITNTNYESDDEINYRLPFRVKKGLKKMKEKDQWKNYPYVGPSDMLMVFPSIRLGFCQGGAMDSAIMEPLRYKSEMYNLPNFNPSAVDWEVYGMENYNPAKLYTVDMLFYVNKILLSAEKIEENAADITATMLDFSNAGRLTNPTGNSIMDQLQMEYSGNLEQHRKQKALTDTQQAGPANGYVIPGCKWIGDDDQRNHQYRQRAQGQEGDGNQERVDRIKSGSQSG